MKEAKKYSIAQARDNLAFIVHELEKTHSVEITRRGHSVAVLLSKLEYDRLQARRYDFWDAYQDFIRQVDLSEAKIDPNEVFAELRDNSEGRRVNL